MKLKLFFCVAFVSIAALVSANPITKSEARQVAQELVGVNDTSSDDVPVAPYYIFSRGAGQGYVIVSGDDSTAPIIGYTEQGDFDESLIPEQLTRMLKAWSEGVTKLQNQPTAGPRRTARARAIATYKKNWTDVPALVKTHWHQSSPYNNMAPVMENGNHCLTGCVATAGSQIAYYFRKDNPSALQYDTPTYSYGTPVTVSLPKGTPIEWNLMKLSGSGTTAQNNAVATLMYALGTSAGLTYGSSTSGHNYRSGHWNMADALKGQFNISYSYKGKWDATQQEWETIIYNNLKTGRPMLYSGVHPESGGHSVVLDGYQASTGLFHFNFGWGGNSDGWYTVDDATGMNGFNDSQDLVYNFTPQYQNLSGEIKSGELFHKAPSTVEVEVTNNGTLDYSGFYIMANSQEKLPSQTSGSNTTQVVASGKSATLSFEITPSSQGTMYLFLIGSLKNKQVLDTLKVEVTPTQADLHVKKLTVDVGNETVENEGVTYGIVNNTTATVSAIMYNGENGTYCMPAFRSLLEVYDPDKKTWSIAGNSTKNNIAFEVGQSNEVEFVYKDLTPGKFYRAYVDKPSVASTQTTIQFDIDDTYLYFTVREADLKVTAEGASAVVTGRWNNSLFKQQATDKGVCSYDITGLSDLSEQPVAANLNALFYASSEQTDYAAYNNIVVGDVCEQLAIQMDADFKPAKEFTAKKARFLLTNAEVGKWRGAMIPFAFEVPYGMQMRKASELTTLGMMHNVTREVNAFDVVTFLPDRNALNCVEAENLTITTNDSISLFDGNLLAYTYETALPDNSLVLGEYLSALYYVKPADDMTTLSAFSPVLLSTSTRMRTTPETLADGYYKSMSVAIQEAYDVQEQSVHVSSDVLSAFLEVLKTTEDMFTYRSHTTESDITAQTEALKNAIKALNEAEVQGIVPSYVTDDDSPVVYYNLSGQRISRPAYGIVIVKQGNKTRKMLIK